MPRSPSRDLADRYDGNRDYVRRWDGVRRAKYALAAVALVVPVGWAAYDLAGPRPTADYAHTHGPLAEVHAPWDGDCAACHRSHGVSELRDPFSLLRVKDRWHDLSCEKCHAGPAHHTTVADGGAFHAACANCHHDHAGRTNSLVRIVDSHCTRCHADLPAHTAGPPQFHASVTDFAATHPEFRPLTEAPKRTLKFSHAVHMTPGLPHTPGGKEVLTGNVLRKLFSEEAARRYEVPGKPDDPIRLTCASCHQLDGRDGPADDPFLRGEPRRAIQPSRAEGAYYLPVNFDAHCKACHPLTAPAVAGDPAGFELPHRQQPAELKDVLLGEYARRLATAERKPTSPPSSLSGRFTAPRDDPAAATFRAEADRRVKDALALVVGGGSGCGKCHTTDPAADPAKVRVHELPDRPVWFPHAKFSHAAHRGLTCADCHPGTDRPLAPGEPIVENEPVRIAGVGKCRECHAPAGRAVETGPGTTAVALGVRHACTDCHRYHHGDHPLLGRGAAARAPARPLSADEFRRGGRSRE
jgi:mono/diheme cytochrome c family protein